MSWTEIVSNKRNFAGRVPANGVRVSIHKQKNRDCQPIGSVLLGEDVMKKLGWTHGLYVNMQRGVGEHHGQLRLSIAPTGRKIGKCGDKTSRQGAVTYVIHNALPHGRESAPYRIENGALIVTLPPWMLEPLSVAAE